MSGLPWPLFSSRSVQLQKAVSLLCWSYGHCVPVFLPVVSNCMWYINDQYLFQSSYFFWIMPVWIIILHIIFSQYHWSPCTPLPPKAMPESSKSGSFLPLYCKNSPISSFFSSLLFSNVKGNILERDPPYMKVYAHTNSVRILPVLLQLRHGLLHPAGRMYVTLIFYTDCPSSFTQSFNHFSINAGHRRISSERKWLI